MTEFSSKEAEFLKNNEAARIATTQKNIPHVKPVSFVFYNNNIWIATDYDTRTFKNIKSNPNTSITIDIYKSGHHKAICAQGKVEVIENGSEFKEIYSVFFKKFHWVKKDPWKENEAPFLKFIIKNKVNWGLN